MFQPALQNLAIKGWQQDLRDSIQPAASMRTKIDRELRWRQKPDATTSLRSIK
jgi:hypothetical protein